MSLRKVLYLCDDMRYYFTVLATLALLVACGPSSPEEYSYGGGDTGSSFNPGGNGGQNPGGQDYYDADYTVVDDDKK